MKLLLYNPEYRACVQKLWEEEAEEKERMEKIDEKEKKRKCRGRVKGLGPNIQHMHLVGAFGATIATFVILYLRVEYQKNLVLQWSFKVFYWTRA